MTYLEVHFKDYRLNEHFLFHGAPPEAVEKILSGGFDHRRGEDADKLFGLATYFTPVVARADIDTEDRRQRLARTAKRELIIARAALGEPYRAREKMPRATRPPDGPDGMPLDSVLAVGGSSVDVDHTEVMLFERFQALPLCVVTYSHEEVCACAECGRRPAALPRGRGQRPAPKEKTHGILRF